MASARDVEVTIFNIAKGGDGVGRDADGKVVFVAGALPGERVRATIESDKKSYANATLDEVLVASPIRIKPPCETWHRGCGGCDLMHAAESEQVELKRRIVTDALERIARMSGVAPTGNALSGSDYRTTVRAIVANGRAGYRRRASHDAVAASECVVAHPMAEEILVDGSFGTANEVTVRVGAHTGDRLVLVAPTAGDVVVPDDVVVVGADDVSKRSDAFIHEEVGGRRWRISALSFFQSGPTGAGELVAAVGRAISALPSEATVVDLYSGVGLLAAAVGDRRVLEAVDLSASACGDARVNLGTGVDVVRNGIEQWRPRGADIVLADPGRDGLGGSAVSVIERCGASSVVLVGCDAASLARDADLFAERSYLLRSVELVDMFPNTSHTETVALFER